MTPLRVSLGEAADEIVERTRSGASELNVPWRLRRRAGVLRAHEPLLADVLVERAAQIEHEAQAGADARRKGAA